MVEVAKNKNSEPKVEVIVSPIVNVLANLAALGYYYNDASCVEIAEDIEKTLPNLRQRLKDNIQRYFNPDCYPGVGLLSLLSNIETASDVSVFLKRLEELSLTDMAVVLLSFGRIFRGNVRPQSRIEDLLNDRKLLIQHIEQNMSVSANKVELLADIVLNPAKARDDLAELIEHFWYVLLQPEKTTQQKKQEELAEEAMARIKERGPLRFISDITTLQTNHGSFDDYDCVIVAPSVFYGQGLIATESLDETCLILLVGPDRAGLHAPTNNLTETKEPIEVEFLASVYNTLGDKTRLEIVRRLTERPYYGQELAKLLSISNATVFHHLSMLNELNIVHLERIEHRVYYVLNTEKLQDYLTRGSQLLAGNLS